MLEAVKLALRIKTTAFDSELDSLIAACRSDLQLCGIVLDVSTDSRPLIQQAAVLYCKANFGSDPDSEKYQKSYDRLKMALSLASEYNEVQNV